MGGGLGRAFGGNVLASLPSRILQWHYVKQPLALYADLVMDIAPACRYDAFVHFMDNVMDNWNRLLILAIR